MSTIKLSDKQTCRLIFTHATKKVPSSLYIARNPLTGDWLQEHKVGDDATAYYGSKSSALSLANKIVAVSAKNGLTCNIEIGMLSV